MVRRPQIDRRKVLLAVGAQILALPEYQVRGYLALGTTAPEGSATVPEMDPVAIPCGNAGTAKKTHAAPITSAKMKPFKNAKRTRNFISSAPGTFKICDSETFV